MCQRDEYPFYRFMGAPNPPTQYIRVYVFLLALTGDLTVTLMLNDRIPMSENGGAGQALARNVCPNTVARRTTVETTSGGSRTCYVYTKTIMTQVVLSIAHSSWDPDWEATAIWDDHLRQNPCLPSLHHFDDPGFALLTNDPWYQTGSGTTMNSARYQVAPPHSVTQGLTPLRRALDDVEIYFSDEDGFGIVQDRNQSRRATPEELREHLGILPCLSPDCIEEKAALGLDVHGNPTLVSPEATATAVDPLVEEKSLPAVTGGGVQEPSLSTATSAP
ncbi:hypothetical protein SODALDRAFT_166691 [Sodiomyces alkalinus F11]|uniref:Uncharacterized protein n=1 Tax=Sodiomyces alkalinus (strain CBS 110278 / VKM F-3762 / F11) TaxID=1314773 RepID=A0A3N2PVT4_SODAK|nr:hypothetical protein SODALDRAFT_166691 [Sodiomyces alkalinus F11]ROT38620.1 hypothetical protein SODALDRAFT_166691 [Sodiomyces alkalinus F11]